MSLKTVTTYYHAGGQMLRRRNTSVPERDNFVPGVDLPIPGYNVGLVDHIPRRVDTTTTVIRGTNDEEIHNVEFRNKITVASGTTGIKDFQNVDFQGEGGSSECFSAYALGITNIRMRDVRFGHRDVYVPKGLVGADRCVGFRAHHMSVERFVCENVADGFRPRFGEQSGGVFTGNGDAAFSARGGHVSKLLALSPDVNQPDKQGHADSVQIDATFGMHNVEILGVWMDNAYNPNAAQFGPATYDVDGVRTGGNLQWPDIRAYSTFQFAATNPGHHYDWWINENWFPRGGTIFNFGSNASIEIEIARNRVGRDVRNGKFITGPSSMPGLNMHDNKYIDNGANADFRNIQA